MENVGETNIVYGENFSGGIAELRPVALDAPKNSREAVNTVSDGLTGISIERFNKPVTNEVMQQDQKKNTIKPIAKSELPQKKKMKEFLTEHSYREIIELYYSPAFRAKYEQYKEYDYTMLFTNLCESIQKGRLTINKLMVLKILTLVGMCLMIGFSKFPLPRPNTKKELIKDIIDSIRREDTIKHLKKVITTYNAVIKSVSESSRIVKTPKQNEKKLGNKLQSLVAPEIKPI